MKLVYTMCVCITLSFSAIAQTKKGRLYDDDTKEPLSGATIRAGNKIFQTTADGSFIVPENITDIEISFAGYQTKKTAITDAVSSVSLHRSDNTLQEIVITANKEVVKRTQAPVAIATLSAKTIQDAKATTADQLLNKISGVNMVNLGNEQHQMSIRQPMTTKSLFLYLEDGIPVRTTGLYNHNALLEMNMAAVKSIEVIKGPSSSLYGSEAIGGVVNFITAAPSVIPVLKLSVQANNIGYKRTDLISSMSAGKWGFVLSGYYADKSHGFLEYTDFHKGVLTGRIDYRFSDKTSLSTSLTWLNYYSDMAGGIDSLMFTNHSFKNPQTFTYRKVKSFRYRSTLTHLWNDDAKTTFTALFRDNSIGQNPAYRVKDDYRRQGNIFVGQKDLAHGEINESSFNSYSLIAQHRQHFAWKNAVVIGGLNLDLSPSRYDAEYIRIKKDSVSNRYVSYQLGDSVLTNYATKLNNYAAFMNFEFSPIEKLRVVASFRYDLFHYDFNNHLTPSSFSGSPDTVKNFHRLSPKIGLTYNFSSRIGIYTNYSEGFVPPQVSELFTGVKVPNINPSVFYNYEIGGWVAIIKNKLNADLSIYQLNGTNEIISVRLDDGTFANQNAGRTSHKGIELGLNYSPINDISFRLSGSYSKHVFTEYIERGTKYDGNEMNNAPNWIFNTEIWYKPSYLKGLRLGAELQYVGSYYVDPQNTAKYDGYKVLNLRAGYQFKGIEVWLNLLNAASNYYSYITSKSSFGYSYQLAEPRNFNAGLSYDFGNLFKKNKQ
jgi:iron complex outermembrane receptor protein